jgi:hypothetical protein
MSRRVESGNAGQLRLGGIASDERLGADMLGGGTVDTIFIGGGVAVPAIPGLVRGRWI